MTGLRAILKKQKGTEWGGLEHASELEVALEYKALAVVLQGRRRTIPGYKGKYRGLKWFSGLPVIKAMVADRPVSSSNLGICLLISFFCHFAASSSSLTL